MSPAGSLIFALNFGAQCTMRAQKKTFQIINTTQKARYHTRAKQSESIEGTSTNLSSKSTADIEGSHPINSSIHRIVIRPAKRRCVFKTVGSSSSWGAG
jgi:hypothetical protein